MGAALAQAETDASVPGSNDAPAPATVTMLIDVEAMFSTGHALSSASTRTFTGVFARSPVQQSVAIAGSVPVTVNVAPGSKANAFDTTWSVVAGSPSENTTSTQNDWPSHTSMLLGPVSRPAVLLERPAVAGAEPVQFSTTNI